MSSSWRARGKREDPRTGQEYYIGIQPLTTLTTGGATMNNDETHYSGHYFSRLTVNDNVGDWTH